MSYITNNDIALRLGSAAYVQLADDDGDGQADTAVVDEARLGAEGEVNAYLARRYEAPIAVGLHTELAAVLASITLDLAEYRLRIRRPPVPDDARHRRDEAVDWLVRVSDGRADLPSASPLPGPSSRGTTGAVTGEKRVLTRDELSAH